MVGVLSLLIWLPLIGAIPVLALRGEKNENKARWLALLIAIVSLLLCLWMVLNLPRAGRI